MARKALRGRIGALRSHFWDEDGKFFLAEGCKLVLLGFLVAFTLFSLLSAGVRYSRSSFMEMAVDQYLLHKADAVGPQRLALEAAVSKHARRAASRELLFLLISLLTSWTTCIAAYIFLSAYFRDEIYRLPPTEELRRFLLTMRSTAAVVLTYGFILEAAVLLLLNADGSAGFLATAVLMASLFRFLSFAMGTVLGQALAMSALDGEGGGQMNALGRPLRLLLAGPPGSDPEHLV